jgi:anthranilate phosphoribosyltransferase
MMKEILNHLFSHKTLSRQEAKEILIKIGNGQYSEPEIASFLTVYLMRKISAHELAGFRDALLELCIPVSLPEYESIDVCGTGGDEKNTFNISTLTAFVLAGAGIKVVKHGNYALSSASGSSNILEHYGYKFGNDSNKLRNEIEKANICYLHAPIFHPAMKSVGPVRKSLKVKTFFNILGPMVNPCRPKNQLVGVFSEEVLNLYNDVYKDTDINYCIIYCLNGYDEISLTGKFRAVSNLSDDIFSPEDLNLKITVHNDLYAGKTVEEAVKIFDNIINGRGTESQNSVVIANAAMGLKCINSERSIEECVQQAQESLLGKKALGALKKLIDLQQ